MNTRRKFLRNGGIVASAILAFDPLSSLAGPSALFGDNDAATNTNSIILLHTNHGVAEEFSLTAAGTGSLAGRADNIVLLNASNNTSRTLSADQELRKLQTMTAGGYSAALADASDLHITDAAQRYAPLVLSTSQVRGAGTAVQPVRIITKGDIKIGIIGAAVPADSINANSILQEVNSLAKSLKEENGCKVVVCLSSLGYKNTGSMDDGRLAGGSENVDVIISANNTTRIKPHVALTHSGNEVLIDNAGSAATGVGRLQIDFDASGNKHQISFGSQSLSGSAGTVALN